MSVQERSAIIMPENAIVTNETVEKRIAFPISCVPGRIPSMIIGAPYHMFVVIIPLTHKVVFLILPSRKRKFLSD